MAGGAVLRMSASSLSCARSRRFRFGRPGDRRRGVLWGNRLPYLRRAETTGFLLRPILAASLAEGGFGYHPYENYAFPVVFCHRFDRRLHRP
jgi:hypothetical protein